jgi:hypothetical protein
VAYHQSSRLASYRVAFIVLLGSLLFSGCSEQSGKDARMRDPVELGIAIAAWQQDKTGLTLFAMEQLVESTTSFLKSPTTQSRSMWQSDWTKAHEHFLAASILYSPDRFRQIDAWPIATGFLDSLPNYPGSGIVNDSTLDITSSILQEQHQITDESEVALGFHVLEYYAFKRELGDFETAAPNLQKRQQLIQLAAELLRQDITSFSESQKTESDRDSHSLLLSKIQLRLQLLFSEFNLLGEHGPYSTSSSQNVSAQLDAIAELLDEPIGLNHFLIELNPQSAQTFNETLVEAQNLLPRSGQPNEETSSRLVLLISSLSQQLGDLAAMLPVEREI